MVRVSIKNNFYYLMVKKIFTMDLKLLNGDSKIRILKKEMEKMKKKIEFV